MAKVYRLHNGQDGTGWFVSNPITKDQLNSIKTEGKDIATSIPSPFARIDLVKSAFAWVSDNGIDGQSAQHKLVSDALDVAQLFFLYPKYKDKIKIVSWNPRDRFEQIASDGLRHSVFSETLKIFWDQDSNVYNFGAVRRLYFLLNNSNQVIGGTSPATLFFSAPDVHDATSNLNIVCNSDVLFDNKYFSLARRDKSFIEYMFTLSIQPNFAILFPDVYSYLEEVKKFLPDSVRTKIAILNSDNIQTYSPCLVRDNSMNPCEILGIPLGVQSIDPNNIEQESDFVINSELPIQGLKPLILPNNRFAQQWIYTTEDVIWNPNNNIPDSNTNTPANSVLPVQGGNYYWLSAGNFLEDTIIELPYTIDSTKFLTAGSTKYLLPLTPKFFQYFKVSSVSKFLKIENLAGGGVDVKLAIPVKNGEIVFKKTYNRGDIVILEVHLAILPFLRTKAFDIDYTIGIQDARYEKNEILSVETFEKGIITKLNDGVIRRPDEAGSLIKSIYYKSKTFDCVRLNISSASGFIVPNMKEYHSNQQVSFAIDFGTTNTHIEYKFANNISKALDSTMMIPLWESLLDKNANNLPEQIRSNDEFEREIIPYQFHQGYKYKFPFRTALIYNNDINFNQSIEVFRHVNNYFLLEKVFYTQYVKVHTKLKWGNYEKPEDKKLIESYIDYLLFLVLYKTILLNGDPKTTRITWFYPVSMDSYELGIFTDKWQKSYQKIFKVNNLDNLNEIPESIAPYLYYRSQYPGLSLSIDIGGGSSDIAVFQNASTSPEFISSFRFAGNAIFGDSYIGSPFGSSADNNGYVHTFKESAEKAINAITDNSAGNIKEIFENIIRNRKDSADFSSFLFSLENENGLDFNYTSLLQQDRRMKLPILLFYGAIIYYSASLLSKKSITEIPKNILLSGTASKTIRILDSNITFPNISKLFEFIFKKVMKLSEGSLKIALAENPKEITCKGALKANTNSITNCEVVFWLGGESDGDEGSFWDKALNKKNNISVNPLYSDLNDEVKENLEGSLNQFFELLDRYFKNVDIENDFGIDKVAYSKFQEIRSMHIKDFLGYGLEAFHKSSDKHIEETLFFYPLVGILNKLAFELSNIEDEKLI